MAPGPTVVVIGSANRDLVVRVEHIPAPGETVIGDAFTAVSGGKGANQAVAAARLGAKVHFVGCVGADAFGVSLRGEMAQAGIDVTHLREDAGAATGVALIGVDAHGQNAITVAPGANHRLRPEDVENARTLIAASDAVLIQMEIPIDTVEYAIAVAASTGTRVVLNPAPVRRSHPLSGASLRQVSVLTPNAQEAANLLGYGSADDIDMESAARALLGLGVPCVVITLGSEGCLVAAPEGMQRIASIPVNPIDTTAAGDCFTAALAVALMEGSTREEAAAFACRAAALSVTRAGAQTSLPTRAEVDRFPV